MRSSPDVGSISFWFNLTNGVFGSSIRSTSVVVKLVNKSWSFLLALILFVVEAAGLSR